MDHIDSLRQDFIFERKHACLQVGYSDAIICFQKSVVDIADCRPPSCHHNLLLKQLWLWEVFGRLITIIGIIGVTDINHWVDFKSPKLLMLIEVMRDSFFWDFFYKWRVAVIVLTPNDRDIFPHFDKDFVRPLTSSSRLLSPLSTVRSHVDLFLFPCSVDIGRSFGVSVPKFELMQHKKAKFTS